MRTAEVVRRTNTERGDEATTVGHFAFPQLGDTLWPVQAVGCHQDTLHRGGRSWLLHRRTVGFVQSDPSFQGAT